jgi:hypothetical protein
MRQTARAAVGILLAACLADRGRAEEPQGDARAKIAQGGWDYLAALVIFEALSGTSPVGLPSKLTLPTGMRIEVPIAQARAMQEAAAEVNASLAKEGWSLPPQLRLCYSLEHK